MNRRPAVLNAIPIQPAENKPFNGKVLRYVANATMVYPLVVMGLLYGEYYLAWHFLGHQPLTNGDDSPWDIVGWLHLFNWNFGVIGVNLMLPLSLASNIAYVIVQRPSAVQASIRLWTLASFWLASFVCPTKSMNEWFL